MHYLKLLFKEIIVFLIGCIRITLQTGVLQEERKVQIRVIG